MSVNSTQSLLPSTIILQIASQYSLYSSWIIFITGFVGNSINIFVFTHLRIFRTNRCVFYLTIESISDIIIQIFTVISTILTSLYGSSLIRNSSVLCKSTYIFNQSCALITFSMICLAAADQFFSTNYLFNIRQICTFKLARHLTFIIIVICLIQSILFTAYLNYIPSVGCIISNPIQIRYATFFLYPVLAGLLPIAIASSFSLLAFRNVRRIVRRQLPIERRRFDRQITAMILLHVIFFVFFTLPYISFRIYVTNVTILPTNLMPYAIVQLIQAILNSVANLYIFISSSSRYRRQVKYVLVKKCWRQWKYWLYMRNNQVHPIDSMYTNSHNEIELDT